LMDESAGRRELQRLGISFLGSDGVLVQAKANGLIPVLRPELDQLRQHGFYLSDRVYRACLSIVDE
jgi:hypothetical protein